MKNVIWISGMPRSGTTWVSQIFASSPDVRLKFCPLFSYEFKNKLDENSTSEDWSTLFSQVYSQQSEYLDQDYLRNKGLVPRFSLRYEDPSTLVIKSTRFHNLLPSILMHHSTIKFVHIVRDPCASIYSWVSNPYEFPQTEQIENQWKTGECRKNGTGEFWGFSDWVTTTQQALQLEKQYPDQFKIIRYESLVQAPYKEVQRLFDYLGLAYHPQTKEFIQLSQSKHDSNKRSVFKKPNKALRWQDHLPEEIIREILTTIHETDLEEFSINNRLKTDA